MSSTTLSSLRSAPPSVQLKEIRRLAASGASLDEIDRTLSANDDLDEEHAAALWLYAQQLTTAPALAARICLPVYED